MENKCQFIWEYVSEASRLEPHYCINSILKNPLQTYATLSPSSSPLKCPKFIRYGFGLPKIRPDTRKTRKDQEMGVRSRL